MISRYDYGGIYTPPSERGAVAVPGGVGGGDWAGGAINAETGWLYIPSHTKPDLIPLEETRDRFGNTTYFAWRNATLHGPGGLPLMQPPYSRITAIDLNTGDHMWMAPTGTGPVNHPALRSLDPLPQLGSGGRFFVLATPTSLLVTAEHTQWLPGGGHPFDIDAERYLWAYDLDDGRLLDRLPLPGNATGNPMTYSVDGRQFIAIPTNSPGAGGVAGIMAFALP